ncbi:MAG: hypothetical protein Q4E65_02075 [Clostridia bacterium]|nr:hypothetical protein [Clostridia bacterium]
MKAFCKTYAAAISGALCLMILLGTTVSLFARADKGTYTIANVTGDEALLASLTLPMELRDDTHTQELRVQDGTLLHTFRKREIIETEMHTDNNIYAQLIPAPDSVSVMEDYTYQAGMEKGTATPSLKRTVDKTMLVMDVIYRKYRAGLLDSLGGVAYQFVTIPTEETYDAAPVAFIYTHEDSSVDAAGNPLYYHRGLAEEMDTAFLAAINAVQSNCIAVLHDSVYALTPCLPACGGNAAVYRVEDWQPDSYTIEPETVEGYALLPIETLSQGKATPIFRFPAAGVRTLRLDAVDGLLCLLLVENDTLTLRVYTPEGELLRRVELGRYTAQDEVWTDAVVTHDGASVLCYRLQQRSRVYDKDIRAYVDAGMEDMLYAVDLQTGTLLSSLQDEWSSMDFGFAKGRWVLSTQGTLRLQGDSFIAYEARFLILDAQGETLCSFDVQTDAWQDQISQLQSEYDLSHGDYRLNSMQKYRTLHVDMGGLTWGA